MTEMEAELGVIQDRIKEAETNSAQSEGAIAAHLKRLKDEFGLEEDEIEDFIASKEVEAEGFESERDKKFRELQEKCPW